MNNSPKATSHKVNDFIEDHGAIIVVGIVVVGMMQVVSIKRSNKALLKAFKNVVQNLDARDIEMQNIISTLRKTKTPFTFYPGVGAYVDAAA